MTSKSTIYEAIDALYVMRHHLSSDAIRSLQGIYRCAAAARYGQPHETGWVEDDPAFYVTHDVTECEAPEDHPGAATCPCVLCAQPF